MMRTIAALALAAASAACADSGPGPGPVAETPEGPIPVQPVPAAASRLVLAVPTLAGGGFTGGRVVSPSGRYREERGAWEAGGRPAATAGMVLSESRAGPPLTDPQDPADVPPAFPELAHFHPGPADLVATTNALGPVKWRRAALGTATCVLFLQRWGSDAQQAPASTLAGYYCAPPGAVLTPGNAEAVVQGVGLHPASTALSEPPR
ncbi:MAG: hypothetical protein AB7G39_02755 [Alphaproteobacteria bacterium]